MKVEGTGNLRGSGSVRRAGKTDGSGGASFAKQLIGETSAPQGVTGTFEHRCAVQAVAHRGRAADADRLQDGASGGPRHPGDGSAAAARYW